MESDEVPGEPFGGPKSRGVGARASEREAPRSGASARGGTRPFLDREYGNVPQGRVRPSFTRKQWLTRRKVLDSLRYWQVLGYQCLWVTLTSAPQSPRDRLRKDFHVLRKRMGRDLGFMDIEYVCVDTLEGHGVLHMIWAWRDPNPRKRVSFYVPFEWLQRQWREIHGAFHVNVMRIGNADEDARRLSRYIVAQYCGGQNALVRVSGSKLAVPLTRMRGALYSQLRSLPERYAEANLLIEHMGRSQVELLFNRWLWLAFRRAWDSLVQTRSCCAYGIRFVWWDGELRRV